MIRKVPSEFRLINNDKIKFEDDRIYIRYKPYFYELLIFAISFGLATGLLIWYYKATQSINGHYFYVKGDPRTWWGAILFFVFYIIFEKCIRIYHVIDFLGECFYRELFFFGFCFDFFVTSKDNIVHLGNNSVPTILNPAGKRGTIKGRVVPYNNEINAFETFQVSFLLKNGKTYDIEFGFFKEQYYDSIRFVAFLSKYWCIPYIVCEENHHLIVCETRNNSYAFISEKIPYYSFGQKLLHFVYLFCVILIMAVFLVFVINKVEKYNKEKRLKEYTNYLFNYK